MELKPRKFLYDGSFLVYSPKRCFGKKSGCGESKINTYSPIGGADQSVVDTKTGNRPLHLAAESGDGDMWLVFLLSSLGKWFRNFQVYPPCNNGSAFHPANPYI